MTRSSFNSGVNARDRQGFTLIELLVVIAIIAILAAILFPVFARVRSSAIKTQCLSNMKQMGVAFRMYVDDFEGVFPLTDHADATSSWLHSLQAYSKSKLLFRCPADTSNNWGSPDDPNFGMDQSKRWTSYGTNFYFSPAGANDDTDSQGRPVSGYSRESQVENLSASIYICELAQSKRRTTDHVHPGYWPVRMRPFSEINPKAHKDGSNYTFLDGHAEFKRFEDTYDTAKGINLWDPW